MYRDYVSEKEGLTTLQNDYGFVAYTLNEISKILDIADFYVKPEFRNGFKSVALFEKVKDIAKEKGCNKITCCVETYLKKPEESLYGVLRIKFKFSHIHNGVIYFYQNI